MRMGCVVVSGMAVLLVLAAVAWLVVLFGLAGFGGAAMVMPAAVAG